MSSSWVHCVYSVCIVFSINWSKFHLHNGLFMSTSRVHYVSEFVLWLYTNKYSVLTGSATRPTSTCTCVVMLLLISRTFHLYCFYPVGHFFVRFFLHSEPNYYNKHFIKKKHFLISDKRRLEICCPGDWSSLPLLLSGRVSVWYGGYHRSCPDVVRSPDADYRSYRHGECGGEWDYHCTCVTDQDAKI